VPLLRVRVRDFQSVADTGIDLGRFTVLLGPSNSGKSAFLRGLRACLRNTIIPGNVRQGTSRALITAWFDDGAVEIERGKSLSIYRLTRDTVETFTKSGRTVPDDVAAFIALPSIADVDATFAFQFDKPFLLAEPGSQVAGVLGSLTNVALLHAAVREANRRRSEASHLIRTRTADLAEHTTRLATYDDLPARAQVLDEAEQRFAALQEAHQRLSAIRTHIERHRTAERLLQATTPVAPPDVTDRLDALADAQARLDALRAAQRTVFGHAASLRTLAQSAREHRDQWHEAEQTYQNVHDSQPACPTCGQPVPAGTTLEGAHR
jgi:DNA repair ATPase RecN